MGMAARCDERILTANTSYIIMILEEDRNRKNALTKEVI